jgi:sucrose-6-phosphate hydrolase SacC (GH32 family)
MFKLPSSWVWDFWFADDGEIFHLYFLKASKALVDPNRRHWRATVGHATSRNLVEWTEQTDAIIPDDTPAFDDLATWTGSVVREESGKWRMFYTAVSRADNGISQRISSVVSDDLFNWHRELDRQILEPDAKWYEVAENRQWADQAWRDPWVFKGQAGWEMLITARANNGEPDNRGVIGRATSPDLIKWTIQPPLSKPGCGFGQIEVIQTVLVEGKPVMIFSCLGSELSSERKAQDGMGGVWAVPAESLEGPFDVSKAYRLTDDSLYVGRIIQDRSSKSQFLAFRNFEDGEWIGGICDPKPVSWVGNQLHISN